MSQEKPQDENNKNLPEETSKAARPLLRVGSKDRSAVEDLQKGLVAAAEKGIIKLPEGFKVDGDFGGKTLGAVIQLQKRAGVTADGIVGPTTWEKLDLAAKGELPVPEKDKQLGDLKVSPSGKTYIKIMEGYSKDVYQCSADHNTIGYGVAWSGRKGATVSLEQADQQMDNIIDVKRQVALDKFGSSVTKLRQNEKDGVMDLVYNLKPNSIGPSFIRSVKELGEFQGSEEDREKKVERLANVMEKYTKGGDANLSSRRKADALLVRGDYDKLEAHLAKTKADINGDCIDELRNGVAWRKLPGSKMPDFEEAYKEADIKTTSVPATDLSREQPGAELALAK